MRRFLAIAIMMGCVGSGEAPGQTSDSALKDRVEQLVAKLASADEATRAAAEKTLIGLGAKILPLLPESAKIAGDDARTRIETIRVALAAEMEKASLSASVVTIQGQGIRLTEALRELQSQTGNRISDLREANGADVTNPALDLDIAAKPFFEALDIIAAKAEVALSFYTGDGSIGIMAGMGAELPDQIGEDAPAATTLIQYSGPFRIQFKSISLGKDFLSGQNNANAQFEIAWEPRLRPMLMGLKAENIKILDDLDAVVLPTVTEESGSVVLRPENPVVEVNVNMNTPNRRAQELKSLKVTAEVTVPAGIRSFRFASLDVRDEKKKLGDVAVMLESTEADDAVWKVNVTLEMPGDGPAFASYQQGLFNNRIWLQKADGTRFEQNGGFNDTGGGGGKLGFQYLFVDAPGKPSDYGLVYETPSRVLTLPLEFEFTKVPLP